ncbi:MAG TPA: hypothetical protein VNY36_02545 [Bacteroidia bacterium]|nr:hypothetical protein [Bacteroidia bacterium]
MNTFSKAFLPAIVSLSLIACGGGNKKTDPNQGKDSTKAAATTPSANIPAMPSDPMAAAAEKMKERRAKGDTLAMAYADLQKFLPSSVDGYTAGKPEGGSVNMGKISYSATNITFKKDNGDFVKVTLADYNQAYNIYTSATAMWTMGVSMDNDEKKVNSVKLDNTVGGFEEYNKKNKQAVITCGIGSRFLLGVEANNQADIQMVESVAKSMDLSKLAAL